MDIYCCHSRTREYTTLVFEETQIIDENEFITLEVEIYKCFVCGDTFNFYEEVKED